MADTIYIIIIYCGKFYFFFKNLLLLLKRNTKLYIFVVQDFSVKMCDN